MTGMESWASKHSFGVKRHITTQLQIAKPVFAHAIGRFSRELLPCLDSHKWSSSKALLDNTPSEKRPPPIHCGVRYR